MWALRLVCGLRIPGFYHATESSASSERAGDSRPNRAAGFGDILENPIDGVLIKNAKVAVSMNIHFQ